MHNYMPTVVELCRQICASRHIPIRLNSPAPAEDLRSLLEQCPASYRSAFWESEIVQFYSTMNGMRFGDEEVGTVNESYWITDDLISFHNWGDGDFDCCCMTGVSSAVYFLGHDPPKELFISSSFASWLIAACVEVCEHGRLAKPDEVEAIYPGRLYTTKRRVHKRY